MRYDPTLDHAAVVTVARTAPGLPALGAPLTPQQGAEVCAVAACLLRARGEDACLLGGKTPAQNHGVIQGERVATDIVCYPSTGLSYDCLIDDGKWVGWQQKDPISPPAFAFTLTCADVPDSGSPSASPSAPPPPPACPCADDLSAIKAELQAANEQRQVVIQLLIQLIGLVEALPDEAALRANPLPVKLRW